MSLPSYELEVRASEQRKRIHNSLTEFKDTLRKQTALKPLLRKYLLPVAGGVSALGLLTGYAAGGWFFPGK